MCMAACRYPSVVLIIIIIITTHAHTGYRSSTRGTGRQVSQIQQLGAPPCHHLVQHTLPNMGIQVGAHCWGSSIQGGAAHVPHQHWACRTCHQDPATRCSGSARRHIHGVAELCNSRDQCSLRALARRTNAMHGHFGVVFAHAIFACPAANAKHLVAAWNGCCDITGDYTPPVCMASIGVLHAVRAVAGLAGIDVVPSASPMALAPALHLHQCVQCIPAGAMVAPCSCTRFSCNGVALACACYWCGSSARQCHAHGGYAANV